MAKTKTFELLSQAFNTFNETALKLKDYYQGLEREVKNLNLQLEKKNQELEENLKEKEQVRNYLHNILESLSTGVLVLDLEGKITTQNRAFLKIVKGYRKEIKAFIDRYILNGGESQKKSTELELKYKNGAPKVIYFRSFPLIGTKNEIMGTVITLDDITRLKRLEEQVNRNSRLRAMGEMAANIAHEIRNPLGSIELFASLLKRDLFGNDKCRRLVEQIISGVKNLNQVISNTLLFTHTLVPNIQKVNLAALLEEALLFSSHQINGKKIKVIRGYSQNNCSLYADSALLKQLFLNIILNALQAMEDGGCLKITTELLPEGGENGGGKNLPDIVEVKISDTGAGMDREIVEKAFDPFFTTRQGGTGLGLTIAHRIIEAHGGTIVVDSSPGVGTTFTVSLPAVPAHLSQVNHKKTVSIQPSMINHQLGKRK
jgi:two-component system sensor histidine kinase FlrB